jgi:hypothetical protein
LAEVRAEMEELSSLWAFFLSQYLFLLAIGL